MANILGGEWEGGGSRFTLAATGRPEARNGVEMAVNSASLDKSAMQYSWRATAVANLIGQAGLGCVWRWGGAIAR